MKMLFLALLAFGQEQGGEAGVVPQPGERYRVPMGGAGVEHREAHRAGLELSLGRVDETVERSTEVALCVPANTVSDELFEVAR